MQKRCSALKMNAGDGPSFLKSYCNVSDEFKI